MSNQKNEATEKVFGARKLTGADPVAVTSTLTALGPWGVALLAAYFAGQGLVRLAEKIRSARSVVDITAQAVNLTAEEITQVQQAVKAMELEQFAQTNSEAMEWIKEHPPVLAPITTVSPLLETQTLAKAVDTAVGKVTETANESTCSLLMGLANKLAREIVSLDDLVRGGRISPEELTAAQADLRDQQERAFRAIDVYCPG